MVAGPLDDDTIGGLERQRAMLCLICGILEYAAKDKGHNLALGSLLVGLSRPDARPDVQLSFARSLGCRRLAQGREAKSGNFSEDDHDDNL